VQPGSETPSQETVNSFMHHMFGQDPKITWKIVDIIPTSAPGVSHVGVTVGNQPTEFYVMPGGKVAIVGDLIPFGSDPFAPARQGLANNAKGFHRGSSSPAVQLVEFSDLQCPHCKEGQPIIDRLMADEGNAQLVFQPFPLPMHPWAETAARFAECVGEQKAQAFWPFVQSVYDAQADITEADAASRLTGLATKAGVDGAAAATCSAKPETNARVEASKALGRKLGVNSTPTLFVNGRKLTGLKEIPYESLKAIVEFEAKESGKAQ